MVLNKIFVIVDPTTDEQPAFERALLSAKMTGTRLHLYACAPGPSRDSGEASALELKARELLDAFLLRCQDAGVEAVDELEQGANWSQSAVRAAARCSASMIFKNSFEHRDVQREMRPTSDFTLLRLASCPVLLVKDRRDWGHRRVLAAVNTGSTDNAHIKLTNQIISFAQNFTDAYGSDAHFVTAYNNSNRPPEVQELAGICGAPTEHVHVIKGSAAPVISALADEIEVDLIIIGTVGRSGIKGRVVGNTAEKILDHTEADVLVVT
ncbi:universal stress protein [Pseudohalioglobus lutimaris]|nr:universal stress protein [Pseudohalioglobus lutimaris]